ncbi:MAG: hypothetical protein Q8S11_04430 [Daejeonella sp.]|uniref:hypothetical protein n=1 Tax=Daejeonella sp. TaxID=2805397 RepID=UPI002736E25D|nr:hypothetical protein [Daejeonella sp.]MDP3467553.1 hypothetical protein [Daejeonella sp.]
MSKPIRSSSATKTAPQKVAHFCHNYTLKETDELLCCMLAVLIGENYSTLSNLAKKRLLDYFEALEEVLPALYELQEKLKHVQNQDGKEDTYQDQVSTNDLFASFKRHPE